jgi:hypothetical protein
VLTRFSVEIVESNGTSRRISLTNAIADFAQKEFPVSSSLDDDPKTGWAVTPHADRRHVAIFETDQDLTIADDETLRVVLEQQYGDGRTLARFRLSAATSSRPLKLPVFEDSIEQIVNTPGSHGTHTNVPSWLSTTAHPSIPKLERSRRSSQHMRQRNRGSRTRKQPFSPKRRAAAIHTSISAAISCVEASPSNPGPCRCCIH